MRGTGGAIREDEAGAQQRRRDPRRANPPGADRDLGTGRGLQMGGWLVMGNDSRCRHAARDADTSGGGWRLAGASDVQVGGALRRERKWGAGVTECERDTMMNGY